MRAFIGLDLASSAKLALDSWRSKVWPPLASPKQAAEMRSRRKVQGAIPTAVVPSNFHITLAFLGEISPAQQDTLVSSLETIDGSVFSVLLDQVGHWSEPRITYVSPSCIPQALSMLAATVQQCARAQGINVASKQYQPHVTLVRKCVGPLPDPLLPLSIECAFKEFALFHSISGDSGVQYRIAHRIALRSSISVREQLKRGQY